jgi:hypothetical protein
VRRRSYSDSIKLQNSMLTLSDIKTWCYIQVLRNRSYMYFVIEVVCNIIYVDVYM